MIPPFLQLVVYLSLFACGEAPTTTEQLDRNGVGEISVAIRLSKVVAASLFRAEIVITASDMADIRQDLPINGDTASGVVEDIPAGSSRLFTLNGYDSSGELIYSGSSTANIVAGELVVVRITMRKVGLPTELPLLQILSSVTVSRWTTVTHVTGEIENRGVMNATNVVISCIARNNENAPISDDDINLGTINSGEKLLFTAKFSETQKGTEMSRYVAKFDYTILYDEGGPITGRVLID